MRKRKERVEKWREEQRKKAMENIGEIKKELEEMKQGKKWSLEDDDGQFWSVSGSVHADVLSLTRLCVSR